MDRFARMERLYERLPILWERIQRMKQAATKTTAYNDGMPHAASAASQVERGVVGYLDAQERYDRGERELCALRRWVLGLPNSIPAKQRLALRLRYVERRSVAAIAGELGISERQCYRLLSRARSNAQGP